MDPFSRLQIGSNKFQTKVAINQGKYPIWNQTFKCLAQPTEELLVEFYDKDIGSPNPDFIASASLPISKIFNENIQHLQLSVTNKG